MRSLSKVLEITKKILNENKAEIYNLPEIGSIIKVVVRGYATYKEVTTSLEEKAISSLMIILNTSLSEILELNKLNLDESLKRSLFEYDDSRNKHAGFKSISQSYIIQEFANNIFGKLSVDDATSKKWEFNNSVQKKIHDDPDIQEYEKQIASKDVGDYLSKYMRFLADKHMYLDRKEKYFTIDTVRSDAKKLAKKNRLESF